VRNRKLLIILSLIASAAIIFYVVENLTSHGGSQNAVNSPPASGSICDTAPSPCTSHVGWPDIDGLLTIQRAPYKDSLFIGTALNDELLGHGGDDTLYGLGGDDVLWGDYDPEGNGPLQHDHMYGGPGNDWIYASHGNNTIRGGPGNDHIRAHFGRGTVNCGRGRDLIHFARSRRHLWKIVGCEVFWP
jgi:Ca2+-binding RTX toxin-like protein